MAGTSVGDGGIAPGGEKHAKPMDGYCHNFLEECGAMQPIKEFLEEELVDQIRHDLEKYFETLDHEGFVKCPDRLTQAFEDLDAFCGDLVAAYEEFGALILEVKVRASDEDAHFLPSYKEDQHLGLKVLQAADVPVYFAYNESNQAAFKKKEVRANLNLIRAPKPDELDIVINPDTRKPYRNGRLNVIRGKTLLDVLVDRSQRPLENVCAALAYTFDAHEAMMNSGIGSLSTKILVFIYHKDMNSFVVLDSAKARELMKTINNTKFLASHKGGPEFAKKVTEVIEVIDRAYAQVTADLPETDVDVMVSQTRRDNRPR